MNSSMFGVGGFKTAKCKTLLRLAMARIKLLRNKRGVLVKQMRKDIAQLLSTGQDPSARIRVEHIAREQNVMAAYDMIELFCELIIVRLPIIESNKVCPMDLKEAICTLIFASPRCSDLPELLQIRSVFSSKYGKEFVAAALELRPECGVNRRVIEKLSVRAPSGETKLKLLMEIAAEHHVNWDHEATLAELLKKPEDLLDGHKKFFGASEAPIPEPQPPAPKPEEVQAPVSDPQRPTAAPTARTARPAPSAVRRPTQPPSPPPPQKLESPSKVGRNKSPNFDLSPPNSRRGLDHNTRAGARESSTHTTPAYDNVAAAAQAAAQSADRAVAAARVAARLAETHPFKREQPPPPPSRTVSQGSRPQQSSSSDDDDDDDGWSNIRSQTEPMTRQQRQRLKQQQRQEQEQGRGAGNVYVTSDSYYRTGSNSLRR